MYLYHDSEGFTHVAEGVAVDYSKLTARTEVRLHTKDSFAVMMADKRLAKQIKAVGNSSIAENAFDDMGKSKGWKEFMEQHPAHETESYNAREVFGPKKPAYIRYKETPEYAKKDASCLLVSSLLDEDWRDAPKEENAEREYFGIPTLSKEADRICSDATYAHKQRTKPQSFIGKWEFLSNMYLSTVILGDLVFPSAENAFQAMKCKTRKEMEQFQYITPYEAKKRGAQVDLRSNWKEIKDKVMKKVLQAKFEDQELAIELLRTDDMLLCEKNFWGDTEWGKCYVEKHEDIFIDEEHACSRTWHEWQGENKLGKLLCEVRQEIKDSHVYDPYLIGYAEQADIDVDWIGRR